VITGSSELEEAEAVASFLEDSNGVLGGSRRVPCAGAVPATEYSYWGAFARQSVRCLNRSSSGKTTHPVPVNPSTYSHPTSLGRACLSSCTIRRDLVTAWRVRPSHHVARASRVAERARERFRGMKRVARRRRANRLGRAWHALRPGFTPSRLHTIHRRARATQARRA